MFDPCIVVNTASVTFDAFKTAPTDLGSISVSALGCLSGASIQFASGSGPSMDSGRALLGGMLAGATAGAAVDFALYPLDTIKTRLQTGSRWPPPHLLGGAPWPPSGVGPDGGGPGAAWRAAAWLRELAGLYAGVAGSLAAHVPASAVFFAVYETSKVRGRVWIRVGEAP